MKVGKSYKLSEFLDWTRRKLYVVLALAIIPVVLYQLLGQKWIALPWSLAVLLGTATSFIVGFKNAQTYNRTVEAQQVWTRHCQHQPILGNNQPRLPDKPEEHEDPHPAPLGLADRAALSTARPPSLGKRDQQREH